MGPSDHANVKGGVPPETETWIEPVALPKHSTFTIVPVATSGPGCATVKLLTTTQPFASVTLSV